MLKPETEHTGWAHNLVLTFDFKQVIGLRLISEAREKAQPGPPERGRDQ
jgi:hypothetical protein